MFETSAVPEHRAHIERFQVLLDVAQSISSSLAFGRHQRVTYAAADVAFMGEVAKPAAVAVENALNLDEAQALQGQLALEFNPFKFIVYAGKADIGLPQMETVPMPAASLPP